MTASPFPWFLAFRHFWAKSLDRLDDYLHRLQENGTRKMSMEIVTANRAIEHADGVLVMRRVFDAPPERVFDAWTQAGHFAQWFGPKGASMPHCVLDPRPGGLMHFFVRVPGDIDVWCKGVFGEVTRPSRLAWRWHFSNEAGERVEREGFALETAVTVT